MIKLSTKQIKWLQKYGKRGVKAIKKTASAVSEVAKTEAPMLAGAALGGTLATATYKQERRSGASSGKALRSAALVGAFTAPAGAELVRKGSGWHAQRVENFMKGETAARKTYTPSQRARMKRYRTQE